MRFFKGGYSEVQLLHDLSMAFLLQNDELLKSEKGVISGLEVALSELGLLEEAGVSFVDFFEEYGEIFGKFGLYNLDNVDQLQFLCLDDDLCHNRICCGILYFFFQINIEYIWYLVCSYCAKRYCRQPFISGEVWVVKGGV